MARGRLRRIAIVATALWLPVAAAAQTATESDQAANVSELLDWIDDGLERAAAASQPATPPVPALGEGPVGQALGWLFGGDGQTAGEEPSEPSAPEPAAKAAAAPAEAGQIPATPIAAQGAPKNEPMALEPAPGLAGASQPRGLLLPVATP